MGYVVEKTLDVGLDHIMVFPMVQGVAQIPHRVQRPPLRGR